MQDMVHRVGQAPGRRLEVRSREAVGGCIRSVSSGDEEGLRRMSSRLSGKTIYQRFHMPYPRVPEWALASFMRVDHRAESLVAVIGGEIAGQATYVRSDGGREAEFALVVEDRRQSQGVGKLLLAELATRARHRGVEIFTGEVLGENRRVLGLLNAVFAEVHYLMTDGVYHVRVPLRTPAEADCAQTVQSAA